MRRGSIAAALVAGSVIGLAGPAHATSSGGGIGVGVQKGHFEY